ncbi:winged helix-turn-helix transcriptional regulator [Pedobacter sp. WC2423]|uniref:winged helix-turn-helix transcriptional regulator n=1 Tax=Pedobacter sp. WC2423 TaxID=3234142 RepID=UPI0034673D26
MAKEKELQKFDASMTERCTASLAPVGDALYAIGGKWKLRIIIALSGRSKRFNELLKLVDGISGRVLSAELKELEMNGFVHRNVLATYPVSIEYELAPYSHSLREVITALSEWGLKHKEKIRAERSTEES